MKLGFIGGAYNALYIQARALAAQGKDVTYFHIPSPFIFNHPLWEHRNLFVPYHDLYRPQKLRDEQKKWTAPSWMKEKNCPRLAKKLLQVGYSLRYLSWTQMLHPGQLREMAADIFPFYDEDLKTCDVVVASSLTALLACQRAGVPYVFIPMGQDLRDAAGLGVDIHYPPLVRIMASAVRGALFSGSQGADMNRLLVDLVGPEQTETLPFLVDTDVYQPRSAPQTFSFLPAWVNEVLLNRKKIVFFMPSRLSDRWKGTDFFLSSFLSVCKAHPDRFLLILSGWGDDYEKYRKTLGADPTLKETICFMEGGLSKPVLKQMLGAVDVVVDQFVIGWYGSAFIEAAACAKMILFKFDREKWESYVDTLEAPPVRPCQTQAELTQILEDVATGALDTQKEGALFRTWVEKNHSLQKGIPDLLKKIESHRERSRS